MRARQADGSVRFGECNRANEEQRLDSRGPEIGLQKLWQLLPRPVLAARSHPPASLHKEKPCEEVKLRNLFTTRKLCLYYQGNSDKQIFFADVAAAACKSRTKLVTSKS